VAHPACFAHDRVHQRRKLGLDRRRAVEAQFECLGDQTQQDEKLRKGIQHMQRIQKVGHSNLVRREPSPHRWPYVITFESDKSTRRASVQDGIDEDHIVGLADVRQQGETERPTIEDPDPIWDLVAPEKHFNCRHTQTVVTAENVAQSENQERPRASRRRHF
jgi:hypothetical protein